MFVSGFCSLAYQVVWLREFRLVFGGSTLAASAVLAVFMGALGLGSWILGHRADYSMRPGRFYAVIESLIGLTVLISPLLLILGNKLYYMTGGIQALGSGAIVLQILIAILVIAVPCFIMGGTLPAAIRLVETNEDEVRQASAVMYGTNIAGAVIGALSVNFYGLELFGNTMCLVMAAGLNLLLAAGVYLIFGKDQSGQTLSLITQENRGNVWLLYGVAFASGFAFFVLELLWFRSSIPLLGGSIYNFGLILVLALMGMSAGGLIYSVMLKYLKPSYSLLAIVSVLFALAMATPYIWGDGFARFCMVLQAGYISYPFVDKLWVWVIIAGCLVVPTSVMAGIQFPLILSLIGKGRDGIGQQIGKIYAFNTAGAVLGAMLGGFVFIPGLSITKSWLLMVIMTLVVAIVIAGVAIAKRSRTGGAIAIAMACAVVMLVMQSSGLTVYWLQSPIGFGRATYKAEETLAQVEHAKRARKHAAIYQYDGREISGSLMANMDLSLMNNGKSDGSALGDASTQIMLTMLGALLHHGDPKNACVIGLGTGTSAGWLAQIASIESVDVLELEPRMVNCASYFAAVNHDAVDNKKVNILLGDAREILMTSKGKPYDLIASEPSNPHRAGVANLYTREFYQTVADKLQGDGVFTQWLQAYEIEVDSVHLIMATLRSVFPQVCLFQTQETQVGDIVFVCFKHRKELNVPTMTRKMQQKSYALGVERAWGVNSVEGVLAHSLANSVYVDKLAKVIEEVNTDDHNLLEFRVGRSGVSANRKLRPAVKILEHATKSGSVIEATDHNVQGLRFSSAMATLASLRNSDTSRWKTAPWFDGEATIQRMQLYKQLPSRLARDPLFSFQPLTPWEEFIWAKALMKAKDRRCLALAQRFKDSRPLDYHAVRLNYFWVTGDTAREDEEVLALLQTMRGNIWHLPSHSELHPYLSVILKRCGAYRERLQGREDEALALLQQPYGAHVLEDFRIGLRWILARRLGAEALLTVILHAEPHFPFNNEDKLKKRMEVYRELGHPNLKRAERDLRLYEKWR